MHRPDRSPSLGLGAGVESLLRYLRAHRWARRGLSALSAVLLVTALVLLGYPFYTDLYQSRVQSRLDRQLASSALQQRYRDRSLEEGDALTRVEIPKLDVDITVVEGITPGALEAGAGHYPQTPLPCEQGNVAIAGHRTTYGKPFADVDRLAVGDTIVLATPVGSCTYRITRAPFVTHPADVSVVAGNRSRSTLTLTTCHPKGSARQRLVVQASLIARA